MPDRKRIYFKDLNAEQKKRIFRMVGSFAVIFTLVLTYFCSVLIIESADQNYRWVKDLTDTPEQAQKAKKLSKHAQKVKVGTYVENIRRIDMKNSEYRVEILVWFDWKGDPDLDPANNFRIYKGSVNSKEMMEDMHNGDTNYQLVSMDVTVSKNFDVKRFPLGTHQLRFYVESDDPIQEVRYVSDQKNSGINENLTITGFDLKRFAVGDVTYEYNSTHGNPTVKDKEMTSEVVTAMEIKRSDFGLYLKCFIALYATLVWIMISLYICTYHHVDPLGMIPGALFGAVGNIIVGTNLLPDAETAGLVEFGNIWGAIMIIAATIAIISINRVRKLQDNDYSQYYGRFLFYIILAFMLLGEILLPVIAYWG